MGQTWNRDVNLGSGACPGGTETNHLTISLTGSGANPPDHPNDTATDINVSASDRSGGGAKIIYHAKDGVDLTGIEAIDGSDLTGLASSANPSGNLLTLTDTGAKGVTYNYLVVGTYNNATIKTCDPQIHNEEEE
jgi:hypothetical protein